MKSLMRACMRESVRICVKRVMWQMNGGEERSQMEKRGTFIACFARRLERK